MSKKSIAKLTEEEIKLFQEGIDDPNKLLDYLTRRPGEEHGWRFDDNFVPEGAWQLETCFSSQLRIIVVGGFGSGKTRGIAGGAIVFCVTTKDFAFMNAAPLSWQSELMYKFVLSLARGTRLGDLIYNAPKRPYPYIEFRFFVGNYLMVTTMEFMSAEKNANNILGWEGDWANIDEAGLLDDLGETIRNLGSRMRGSINKRARLGRLSMISNSWDNPEFWYRYDLAIDLPKDYLSKTISTRDNKNVTPDQLRLMLKDIPEDEHDRFIEGGRPEGKGNYFSKTKVYACEDENFSAYILDGFNNQRPGYELSTLHGAGVVHYRIPKADGHEYMILADPGAGNAPNRNAPVIMVWDVTDFPIYRMSLAAFWWGAGNGSITPFYRMLLSLMEIYDPLFTGVDSTGPQKNTNEMLNLYLQGKRTSLDQKEEWIGSVDLKKIANPIIGGLDFSSGRKAAFLVCGRLYIEASLMTWPKFVTGIRSQLTNYDPEKDKGPTPSKLTQDIVATLCMSAYVARAWFSVEPESVPQEALDQSIEILDNEVDRSMRLPGADRAQRISIRG